jgi:PleD family two-component response regulator
LITNVAPQNICSQKKIYTATSYRLLQQTSAIDATFFFSGDITMKGSRILVVEDERITALDIKYRLEDLGYIVTAAVSSGQDAIEKAEETKPDLVLMDIMIDGDLDGTPSSFSDTRPLWYTNNISHCLC